MVKRISFFIVLIFIVQSLKLVAQVLPSDSLALVELYTATNGANWKVKKNWLVKDVSTWQGITVSLNRVTIINLPNNNLNGTLPVGFCDLTQLKYLYLSNNKLTGTLPPCFGNLVALNTIDVRDNNLSGTIPAAITSFPKLADLFLTNNHFDELPTLTSLPEFSNLLVQNNNFTFEDFESNMGVLNFQYIAQDSINTSVDTLVEIKDTAILQTYAGGSSNSYQWLKNGVVLNDDSHYSGTTTPFLTINKCSLSDEANYSCRVTNSIVTGLSLNRKAIRIRINDTRLPQIISTVPGTATSCGDLPTKIVASTDSGLPLLFKIVSGKGQLKQDTLVPNAPGKITVQLYNDGDDTYKPVVKDTVLTVKAPVNSTMTVTKIIPVNLGEKLLLSVPFQSGVDYFWINPAKDTVLSNVYTKQFVDALDEGIYTVKAGKNDCYYFKESFQVEFSALHDVVVFELVSPDGDGRNDFFYVQNIEKYLQNEVLILNSWSQQVYKKSNYNNDWNGDDLPAGTYYYIVKIPSLDKTLKGLLYLKK